jgi:hypothetical protein
LPTTSAATDPGAVDDAAQAAELADGGVDGVLDARFVADVGLDERADLLTTAEIGDEHVRAGVGQGACGRGPEPRAAARDQERAAVDVATRRR